MSSQSKCDVNNLNKVHVQNIKNLTMEIKQIKETQKQEIDLIKQEAKVELKALNKKINVKESMINQLRKVQSTTSPCGIISKQTSNCTTLSQPGTSSTISFKSRIPEPDTIDTVVNPTNILSFLPHYVLHSKISDSSSLASHFFPIVENSNLEDEDQDLSEEMMDFILQSLGKMEATLTDKLTRAEKKPDDHT